ncbi:class I SAM-dependent methyltransferase [Lacisediminihabitans changchengi]|uniref:Methyltransferase n=1 Tax=Lacisediminihabitans changchengi TaxID=2787634 RepID=A0A934STC2_9MICO|nr:class I SAM-dependent methyltransferase [Lacisediminihabitans changchengi]MBK4348623.1 methyltransferase [Lacisediminihabitans changchengi]
MTDLAILDTLRRYPDLEAPNLVAVDASDRLILDEAAADVAAAGPGAVVTLGDHYGALTLGALALGATAVRSYQDSLLGERALASNGPGADYRSLPLGRELLDGARVVLLQLPKSLDELDELASAIARFAAPDVMVVAGGRLKHMTREMNVVLGRHFGEVTASLARQKSRALTARGPIVTPDGFSQREFPQREFPQREFNEELDLWVCAHGGAFSGTKLDIGTRFLLSVMDQAVPDARLAIDLGCGTGILAAAIARSRPELRVIATDQSRIAVASAEATMAANDIANVTVVRDIGLESQPDASADLILLNPPFHTGAAVTTGIAENLFREAARVLRPGGELWTVFNSSLGYRPELQQLVGPTREVARNAKFTVAASSRPDSRS